MAGRPRKQPNKVKKRVLQVRLTEEEIVLVELASGDARASAWAREVIVRAAKKKNRREKAIA